MEFRVYQSRYVAGPVPEGRDSLVVRVDLGKTPLPRESILAGDGVGCCTVQG